MCSLVCVFALTSYSRVEFPSLGHKKTAAAAPASKKKRKKNKKAQDRGSLERPSKRMLDWCRSQLKILTGSDGTVCPTSLQHVIYVSSVFVDTSLVDYLWPMKSPLEMREYVVDYLGDSSKNIAFASMFIQRKVRSESCPSLGPYHLSFQGLRSGLAGSF